MSQSRKITLGLRSSSGRRRIQIGWNATGSSLRNAIQKEMSIQEDFQVKRDVNGRPGDELKLTRTSNASTLKLKNGDVLYITPVAGTRFKADEELDVASDTASSLSATGPSTSGALNGEQNLSSLVVKEDSVDETLKKRDGRIERKKTANCQHQSMTQKCIYCTAKEPYDPEYLREQGIKFLSFHSYVRKLSHKSKYVSLEDISCQIKKGCTTHKPWPASICSTCQPPAITLNRQTYRHVDNIMFENAQIVDTFLGFWRNTGSQRLGFLYGKYEVFDDVPLGIKAVVAAIYEPPQEVSRDGIKLIPDDKEDTVEDLARSLGLQRVGWIFSDLIQDSRGTIKHFRNIDSHFLSAQECIMAGHFQSQHPNVCKLASKGSFGSKFCTVLVTGNSENQVHMEGYQVSNQCMALVRDGCLIPTKDAPELGYVRESSAQKYVPDVFFKEKDKYGNEVTKVARPLPVEYLLIDVPVSTPLEPVSTFVVSKQPFPVENRPMEGHLQDFAALASFRKQFSPDQIKDFFRDFHLLLYLATQNVSPLHDHLKPLLEAVRDKKEDGVLAFSNSEHWQTIELLLDAHNGGFQ